MSSVSKRKIPRNSVVSLLKQGIFAIGFGRDGVDAMSENSNFDLNQASTHFALRRNVLTLFEYVEVPECNEPTAPTSPTDLFQITENEEPISANSVPMQLLNQDEQERDGKYAILLSRF